MMWSHRFGAAARQKRVAMPARSIRRPLACWWWRLAMPRGLIEYVQDATSKRYLATVCLGMTTATDDAEGAVVATAAVPPLDRAALELALEPISRRDHAGAADVLGACTTRAGGSMSWHAKGSSSSARRVR